MSSQDKILYKGKNPKDEENRRFSAPKGVHPFIAATILILVTVVLSTIVASFVSNVSSERSKVILNATQTKLSCQYAGFLVSSVTYDCNSGCFTGSPYRINATIENSGSSRVLVSNLFITLTDGTSYRIDGNQSAFSVGDITTKLFDAIRINTSSKIPTETMDLRSEYPNGTNTIALWHFNDGSGNTTTDASRGYTGTLANGSTVCNNSTNQCPQWNASGIFGSAITLDGISDYVNFSDSNDWAFQDSNFTIEMWVYLRNTIASAAQHALISQHLNDNSNWKIYLIDGGATLSFRVNNSADINATVNLANNTWYHVAFSKNGTTGTFYLNGAARGTNIYRNVPNVATNLTIGASNEGGLGGYSWNGSIDEVRISNASRTFFVGLQYNITLVNISAVRVYNSTNALINTSTGLGGVFRYNKTLDNVTTSSEYRVEVDTSDGVTMEKWYPYRPGGACVATSTTDKITFASLNCPEVTDTYYGTDVTFVSCV